MNVNNKKFNLFSFILFLFVSNVNAVNIGIFSLTVPPMVNTNENFTLSIDYTNSTDADLIEPADNLTLVISDYNLNAGADFTFDSMSATAGWICNQAGPVVTCTRDFTPSGLPADDAISNFQINITAGATPVVSSTFRVNLTADLLIEPTFDSLANEVTANTTVLAPTDADLTFFGGASLPDVNLNKGDSANQNVTFSAINNGADSTMSTTFTLAFDSSIMNVSIPISPTGWTPCNVISPGFISCSTFNAVTTGPSTDFNVVYNLFSNVMAGSYPNAFLATIKSDLVPDSNLGNDDQAMGVNIAPPDYEMRANGVLGTSSIDIVQNITGDPYLFELENIGMGVEPTGESLFISYNDSAGFNISAPIITASPNISGQLWSCGLVTGGYSCFNSNTGSGMAAGDKVTFSGTITSIPAGLGLNPLAISASISPLSIDMTPGNNDAQYDITIVAPETDLVVTKFAKDAQPLGNLITSIPVDTSFYYHIHVDNPSSVDANSVSLIDNLPPGLEVINDHSIGWFCSFPTYPGTATSHTVSCTIPTITGFSTPDLNYIILEVRGRLDGSYDNITQPVTSTETDSNVSDNANPPGQAMISVIANPSLTVSKTILSGVNLNNEAEIGGQVVYKILVDNTVTGTTADNVVITDTLPVGVEFAGFPVFHGNFSVAGCDTNSLPIITCTAGASIPVTIAEDGVQIAVNITGAVGVSITNSVSVSSSNAATVNASSPAFDIIAAPPAEVDLDILKDAEDLTGVSQSSFLVNENFNYNIVVHNNGPSDAPIGEVEISDTLPAGLNLNSVPTNADWDCSATLGTVISCTNLTAIPASVGFLELLVSVSGPAPVTNIVNTASVGLTSSATVIETFTSDNIFNSSPIDILPAAGDLTISKSVILSLPINKQQKNIKGSSSFNVNEEFTYNLFVENNSIGTDVDDLVVKDTLPSNVQFLAVNNDGGLNCSFNLSLNEVTCLSDSINPLGSGTSVSIDIDVIAIDPGMSIPNIAQLSSVTTGDNINSNQVLIDIIAASTSLTLAKTAIFNSIPVTSINRGSSYDYQIDVTNTGGVDAINIQIVDVMPSDVTVNSFSGTDWSCTNSGQVYTCDLMTPLASGALSTLNFNVTDISSLSVTQIQNNADATADNALLVTTSNTVNIDDPGAMVKIHQNPDPVIEGQPFDIVVDVTNTGAGDLISASVLNTIPVGFSYGPIRSSLTKAGVTSTCSVAGQDLLCNFDAAIVSGATESIVIPVIAVATVDPLITYTNVTTVSGSGIVPDIIVNTVMNVGGLGTYSYDLQLINFTDPVEVGQQYTYTMFVDNTGSAAITNMHIGFDLSPNLVFHSLNSPNFVCSVSGSIIDCNSNSSLNINPGIQQNAVSFTVSSPSFTGLVTVNAAADIGGLIPNSTFQTTTIIPATTADLDVSLQKTASASSVLPGSQFTYQLTALNNSAVDATNVVITDTLPSNLILNTINAPDWDCSGTTTVICSSSVLLAKASKTIELSVSAPSTIATITNTAQLTSDGNDTVPANNTSQATVQVVTILPGANANIKVTKTASSPSVTSSQLFDWIIEVENLGPGTASGIVVSDLFPAGFELASIALDSATTCQTTISSLNCEMATQSIHEVSTITVSGRATLASGVLENTVTVTSESNDPELENNLSTASILVNELIIPESDLSVSINQGASIQQGKSTTFDVIAINSGPDVAIHPVLDLSVTGLVESVSVNSSSWNCQVAGLSLHCSLNSGSLGVNQQSTLTLNVVTQEVVIESEDLVLSASISSDTLDPNPVNNSANNSIVVTPTPTEGEIENAMQQALGSLANPIVNRAIESVSSYCERSYFTALEGLCDDLYNLAIEGDGESIKGFMEQVAPTEVIGQSSSAAEIITAQFRNIDARLSQLRGGGGGFSMAGLNARYGDGSIPLGMLAYLNETEAEADGVSQPSTDFISPWGFFINGTISMGDRDPTTRELGFDFETFGLTTGIDYRLDSKKVIGLALGYASFDSEIDDKSAKLQSTGVTLTGYGSFYVTDNFYMDARISYGKPDFDQERTIDVTVGDTHIQRTSKGSTTANQYTVAMGVGYHFNKKSWNITPNASFRYIRTNIDGFTENGGGAFDFIFNDQEIKSLVWTAGVSVSKAISLKNGVITPQFDFNYNYESENKGSFIEARFIEAPLDEVFIIETDSADSTYGSAGLGLVYVTSNGRQAYINYRSVIGLEGFSRGTINLGARFEF
jgi:outer membrane autotransporter protein/uncharacterized repeat protein (TIGR01451 family)